MRLIRPIHRRFRPGSAAHVSGQRHQDAGIHDAVRVCARWDARGLAFARPRQINLPSGPLTLDMAKLHGQSFEAGYIDGIQTYFEIRSEVERLIREAAQ